MITWRRASLVVTAAAVMALTTACGQDRAEETPNGRSVGNAAPADGGYGAGGEDGYGAGAGSDGSAAAEAKADPPGQLAVRDSKELGEVVTDSAGFTLFRFDKDTAQPPKSNCSGDCAKTWPVVPAADVSAAPGIAEDELGAVTRADGSKQLTVGGWPMCRYAKDTEPGEVKGQGVGGAWFASAPDGKKAAPAADGGSGNADSTGGAEAGPAGLSTREDPELGEVVVDAQGMTVYRFMKDSTWPMYTFAGDKKPGDTNGQGVGGTWYAVTPEGKPIGAPESE